jgi:hypothetical protein
LGPLGGRTPVTGHHRSRWRVMCRSASFRRTRSDHPHFVQRIVARRAAGRSLATDAHPLVRHRAAEHNIKGAAYLYARHLLGILEGKSSDRMHRSVCLRNGSSSSLGPFRFLWGCPGILRPGRPSRQGPVGNIVPSDGSAGFGPDRWGFDSPRLHMLGSTRPNPADIPAKRRGPERDAPGPLCVRPNLLLRRRP